MQIVKYKAYKDLYALYFSLHTIYNIKALFRFGFRFGSMAAWRWAVELVRSRCPAVAGGIRWSLSSFPASILPGLAILEEVKRGGKAEEGKKGKDKRKREKKKPELCCSGLFWCLYSAVYPLQVSSALIPCLRVIPDSFPALVGRIPSILQVM